MSTLQDLADAIDKAAEGTAPSRASLQSAIVNAISAITKLSVEEIYSVRAPVNFEEMSQELHGLLVLKLEQRFIDKIVASITPAKSISVTAAAPVPSGLPRNPVKRSNQRR